MLKIIRADSPDFSRYYIYSDNEPDKTTKIVNLLKTLPENSFARWYFVSDGDIADPEKIGKYCLKVADKGIPLQEVLSAVDYVEARTLIESFLSGGIKKRQYLVFEHEWTKKYPEIVAEPSREAIEGFMKIYAIPEAFFKALEGLPIIIEHSYNATYIRLRERYDGLFKDLSLAWGDTHKAFTIPMDPFVPYDVDRAIRDRLIRGSELTTTPNDVFKLLNSQRIKKSDLINHFFNRFGLDKNTKVHYIKLTTKSWKNFIYQKESREYVYQKVDRALEKLHSFHDMIFYDLPLLMVIKLHFSGNGQKISTQLSKYVKYIRSEYIRKVGMPKMVNEAIDKNIEGITSKMEELTHSADQLRKEFSMDSEHIAKYLQSDNFAKKVGLNISSGGDPGDVLRKKALRFFINDGFLKDAKIQAESLLKIE